jgi:hypothetical protein
MNPAAVMPWDLFLDWLRGLTRFRFPTARSLPSIRNWNKKIGSGDGLIILHRHPWGGRFQMLVVEERQVIGGNGREPSGQEGWISSE